MQGVNGEQRAQKKHYKLHTDKICEMMKCWVALDCTGVPHKELYLYKLYFILFLEM